MKKPQVLGIIRHALTFIGGLLVMQGIVDDAVIAELSGALMTVIGGIWSIIDKSSQEEDR